ncbi:hypothetical protein PENDEC_c004G01988 [Penicillium decumbens]|uniref:Uncharacterized protein n=1 Tax=Penicillium decumbens TaxID=69771 RepID=A0A1V6PIY5_PENDC|nr:hypothetical protein PENDEC_c004G01988 [Penicillium decumbens]
MLVWVLIPACCRIESLLARHGSFNALQKFRLAAFHLDLTKDHISKRQVRNTWDEIMRIEALLLQLAQKEEDLEKRCLSLKAIPSSQEDNNRQPITYGDPTRGGIFILILLTIALGMEGVAAVTVDVAKGVDRPQEDGGVEATALWNAGVAQQVEDSMSATQRIMRSF